MSKSIIKDLNAGFIVFGSLAVLMITIIALMNYSFGSMFLFDMESTAEMVRVSDSNIITFSDLKHLKAEAGLEKISAYSEAVALVSNRPGIRKDDMKVVLVDEDYSSIYKYEMIEGRFPDEDSVRKGKAHAVISDQLALRLFMTLRVVGNEIEIMGEKYTIFGVYKSRSSVFWSLSGDGFDRVFIPYTAIDSYMELPVDIMALAKKQEQHINDTKIRIDAITGQKPEDNIFDTRFYISAAIKDSMVANSQKINVYSIVENYLGSIMRINIYCALLISVFVLVSTMLYRLLLKAGARDKSILWGVLAIVAVGGASGVMMAILLGFDAYCPLKIWLLVLYYYFVLFSLHKFKTRTGGGFPPIDLTILK